MTYTIILGDILRLYYVEVTGNKRLLANIGEGLATSAYATAKVCTELKLNQVCMPGVCLFHLAKYESGALLKKINGFRIISI